MVDREYRLHNGKRGAALAVRVTPRASKNEIVEVLHDGTIRIRLTVAPSEEATNAALADYLAEILEVKASEIEIVAGQSGRDKLVSILDLDSDTVHQKILSNLA